MRKKRTVYLRKEYSLNRKLAHISQWQQSGEPAINYCQRHGIGYSNFIRWRKRFAEVIIQDSVKDPNDIVEMLPDPDTQKPASFIAVPLPDNFISAETSPKVAELTLSNGIRLCFYQEVSAKYLRDLCIVR